MNLKHLVKSTLKSELFSYGHRKDEWRMLIHDTTTSDILNRALTFTEILECEIVAIQTLEDELREGGETFGCIYFLQLTKNRLKILKRDIKKKKYKYFKIVLTEDSDLKEQIAGENVSLKVIDLNFKIYDSRVFTFNTLKDLNGLARMLKCGFNIHCQEHLQHTLEELAPAREAQQAELILLDRSIDLFTPLLHFYDMYSLMNDLEILDGNFLKEKKLELDGAVWKEIKFVHIAEINKILSRKSHALVKGVKKLDADIPFKDLSKMVLQAPENIKLKEEVVIFLDLADRLLNLFKDNKMDILSAVEQNIATGFDAGGSKYRNGVSDFFNLLDQKITREEKLRLFLMLVSSGVDFQNTEIDRLKALEIFSAEELKLRERVEKLRENFQKRKAPAKQFIYDISRYQPIIKELVEAFIEDKKFFIKLKSSKKTERQTQSVRKTEFIFDVDSKSKYRKKKILILVIRGGVSHQEIKTVYELSESTGVEIIVGSEFVLNPNEFLKSLKL